MRGLSIRSSSLVCVVILAFFAASAPAQVVFNNLYNNGFFVPFSSSTPAGVKYGDSGWLGGPAAPPIALESITLDLIGFDSAAAGSTDIVFTFNDGDPSGLIFGTGAQLYSTTITNVALPATPDDEPVNLSLTIPLPGVFTTGGFNNIGWSIAVQNFSYAGQFGFACSTASGQVTGFYTNNASFYNGSSWSLFAFGPDPNTGVANFVATVNAPEPASAAAIALAMAVLGIRHRRAG